MRIAALALAGIVTVGAVAVPVRAQQRVPAQGGTSDIKALLFDLANSMGMLRGMQQEDSIITLEHWATGTATIGQQRVELPEYRASLNYAVPGMRVDVTQKGPGAADARRSVEVVSGAAAWNESEPGKNPAPAQDKVKERLVHLWTTPMGVVKAASAAGANVKVTAAGGTTTLTFPLPAPVNDVTVTADLRRDASLLASRHATALTTLVGTYITRVQTRGAVVSDTTYAEYGDWNWDDYKADVMLPRRIVRKSGDTTLELTTKNTNTYNPYVIMPVPESIRAQGLSR